MTNMENFINDVTNDAFLKAVENQSGMITITQLDDIIRQHPSCDDLDFDLEHGVHEVERILEKNNRLLTK